MKKFLFVVLLVVLGVFGQKISNNENPAEIQNPVYVQSRVVQEVQELSRKFEYVFIGGNGFAGGL